MKVLSMESSNWVLSQQLKWPKGIALSYNRIGSNYIFKSDYPNALEYDLKALKAYENINYKTGIATVLKYWQCLPASVRNQ